MSDHGPVHDPVRIGLVSVSDRASSGAYEDKSKEREIRFNGPSATR